MAAEPIKIGLLEDVSGDLGVMGIPKLYGSELAVKELNAEGGVLGREVELIHLDPQGDNRRYQEFARRLLQRDKVDVLIGGITSAAREALRPLVNRADGLYFYTNQYEGGVCDANMISVGAAQDSFFEQAQAAGLDLPMGGSIKIMLGFEHKRFAPPTLEGMYAVANWFAELDTPEAEEFKARWHEMWPDETYINDMGNNAYVAIRMYQMLAEKAGSVDKDEIRKVIAAGDACIDAPEGRICIDPKSQHTSHHMRMIEVDAEHNVHVVKDFGVIEPYWLGEIGCDLTRNDPNEQYTPTSLPE